ncbi:MAG: hypothetical protein WBI40_02150 [Methylococcaceae bacterium]
MSLLNGITATAATDFSLFGADVSLSGFGTAGFGISDQSYKYQRFVNNDGTFKRDSVLGGQIDIKLNNEFSITAQVKLAPSINSERDVDPMLTWAFLSWRPTNDLLFRGGRLRVPFYLHSETTDIGETFDFARLPVEVYSVSPLANIDGLSGNKTWNFDAGELTLSGYVGELENDVRLSPYNQPPLSAPASYMQIDTKSYGLVLTFEHDDDIYRIGAHDSFSRRHDGQGMEVTFPFVTIMPDVGYYQVSNDMQGPGVPKVNEVRTISYVIGADIGLGDDFRLVGEYVRRDVRNIVTGPDSQGGYLALFKSFDNWTPYISMAHLQSMEKSLNLYRGLNGNTVPAVIPDAAILNASQRATAASVDIYDQTTWAIGTSYRLSPTSKLKAEWAITKTGEASSFIDTPIGGDSGDKLINVFSFSYNVAF